MENFITFVYDLKKKIPNLALSKDENVIKKSSPANIEYNLRIFFCCKWKGTAKSINHSKCPLEYSIPISSKWLPTLFFHQHKSHTKYENFLAAIFILPKIFQPPAAAEMLHEFSKHDFIIYVFRENCFSLDFNANFFTLVSTALGE